MTICCIISEQYAAELDTAKHLLVRTKFRYGQDYIVKRYHELLMTVQLLAAFCWWSQLLKVSDQNLHYIMI
uniref:AlNc14C14G1605 protein n=1 Tax=Albugo laibachii Nc14 TaxID=890382 RepID=F0W3U0_9STRA|nr:AlNc14C14G1605 [Albugo laibachii Nc14]|eukprot:CCA15688.1 AlNc14C14G1605 [Albugo laibachii Nc14]